MYLIHKKNGVLRSKTSSLTVLPLTYVGICGGCVVWHCLVAASVNKYCTNAGFSTAKQSLQLCFGSLEVSGGVLLASL